MLRYTEKVGSIEFGYEGKTVQEVVDLVNAIKKEEPELTAEELKKHLDQRGSAKS